MSLILATSSGLPAAIASWRSVCRPSDRSKPTLANPTLAIVIRPTLANPTLAIVIRPTLAKPTLANVKVLVVCKDFGLSELILWVFLKLIVQVFFVCFELAWVGEGWGFEGRGAQPRKSGAPKGGGPEGWGARRVGP